MQIGGITYLPHFDTGKFNVEKLREIAKPRSEKAKRLAEERKSITHIKIKDMTQYIDKAAVVAEIERRLSLLKENEGVLSMLAGGMFVNEFKDILSFLDSLEVKEVDINKEISQFIDANFEKATIGHKLSLRRVAKHFFELGLKAQKGEKV